MKNLFALLTATVALSLSARADSTVTLSDVHVCCHSCIAAVDKLAATVPGLTAKADTDASTIVLTAADSATLQKGADALTGAGFYGKSSDPTIKIDATTGAKDQMMQTMTVEHLHLCCGKCVKAVNEILSNVPGVTGNTAAKGAKSFEITGNFNDKAVFDAFQKAGLTGHEKQ